MGVDFMVIDSTKFYIACANARANVSEITKRAGCTVSVLHRIKNGKRVNTLTVGKLAEALGVPAESLLADEQ